MSSAGSTGAAYVRGLMREMGQCSRTSALYRCPGLPTDHAQCLIKAIALNTPSLFCLRTWHVHLLLCKSTAFAWMRCCHRDTAPSCSGTGEKATLLHYRIARKLATCYLQLGTCHLQLTVRTAQSQSAHAHENGKHRPGQQANHHTCFKSSTPNHL